MRWYEWEDDIDIDFGPKAAWCQTAVLQQRGSEVSAIGSLRGFHGELLDGSLVGRVRGGFVQMLGLGGP
jgi:hypothetical protein